MMHANFTALHVRVIEAELLPIKVLYCTNRHFRLFCSHDLQLDPMTFIQAYELDTYSLEVYWMSENELPTLGLSKVIF